MPLKEALFGLGQYAKTVAGQSWDQMQKMEKEDWQAVIDLLHLGVMFTGVDLSSSVTPPRTELGGPPMKFAVGVSMTFRLPDVNVKCGYLSAYHFPGHGVIRGVRIDWDNSELDPWGTFTCGRYCAETGPDGAARERFTPGPEEVHKGLTILESGKVEANALVSTSLGNAFLGLADALRVSAVMRWELKHHKTGYPDGFTALVRTNNPAYYGANLTITGARSLR